MRTLGIDVSHWEGPIDWQQASRSIGFAYFKCTDGMVWVDPEYDHNRIGSYQAGLARAPYHYFQPGEDPTAQAVHFIHVAGKNCPRYIVDVEEDADADENLPGNLLAFLLRCEQLTGIKPAIYTSSGYWKEFSKPVPGWTKSYELLVAHYTADHVPTLPIGWEQWRIWQFSEYFFCPGCSTEVDGDWFNGTLEQCRQWFGNYRQIEPPLISLRARSLFDQLHVRVDPGIACKEVDHLAKGQEVVIDQLGGQDVWIKHSEGWSCVEKDGYRYMEIIK
jgi:lysozyme